MWYAHDSMIFELSSAYTFNFLTPWNNQIKFFMKINSVISHNDYVMHATKHVLIHYIIYCHINWCHIFCIHFTGKYFITYQCPTKNVLTLKVKTSKRVCYLLYSFNLIKKLLILKISTFIYLLVLWHSDLDDLLWLCFWIWEFLFE